MEDPIRRSAVIWLLISIVFLIPETIVFMAFVILAYGDLVLGWQNVPIRSTLILYVSLYVLRLVAARNGAHYYKQLDDSQ